MANDEINVPSLVLILVVSGLLVRHFFFRATPPSSSSSSSSSSSAAAGSSVAAAAAAVGGSGGARRHGSAADQRRAEALERRIEAAVAQVQQMFPDADRREVWWDLRRNGVNVAATTERILTGRLDVPPNSFQPPRLATQVAQANNAEATSGAASPAKPGQPSLIQRYHLQDRVVPASSSPSSSSSSSPSPSAALPSAETAASSSSASPASAKTKAWSASRDERQALLKKRRDDMILEARRKMEAKLAAEKAAASA